MSERRILLDAAAFLDSSQAIEIAVVSGKARPGDIREIVQRYLAVCYIDLAKAPRLLDGDEVGTALRECLPRHFGTKDPLAAVTEDVLTAYLSFLDETEVVTYAYEQRRALAEHAETFRQAVATGVAHRDGITARGKAKTVVHRAEKTGRNDPCPCGSGKKFKKCCLQLGS